MRKPPPLAPMSDTAALRWRERWWRIDGLVDAHAARDEDLSRVAVSWAYIDGRIERDTRDRLLGTEALLPRLDTLYEHERTTRPKRQYVSLPKLAQHLGVYEQHPACWRCGTEAPVDRWEDASGWLERAHVIDRWADGIDVACNLRPLCSFCHRIQPIFEPGDEGAALAWFSTSSLTRDLVRMFDSTDEAPGDQPSAPSTSTHGYSRPRRRKEPS